MKKQTILSDVFSDNWCMTTFDSSTARIGSLKPASNAVPFPEPGGAKTIANQYRLKLRQCVTFLTLFSGVLYHSEFSKGESIRETNFISVAVTLSQ